MPIQVGRSVPPQPWTTWPWIRRSSIRARRSGTTGDGDARFPLGFQTRQKLLQGECVPVVEEFELPGEVDLRHRPDHPHAVYGAASPDTARTRGLHGGP